jgi:ubiquinone/menaquinone biosynthesis C-methylase UbiE
METGEPRAGKRTGDEVVAGNVYDKYHTSNPLARHLMQGFLGSFDRLFELFPGERVLEVGCGEGYLLERMRRSYPDAVMAGLDISYGIVQTARDGGNASVLQASAYELPWPDKSWDVVVACEVMEHLDEPERALAELRRVGRRACLLSVPREPWWRIANMARGRYVGSLGNTPGHMQHWSRGNFAALVSTYFAVKKVQTPFPWTMVWSEIE